MYRPRNPHHPAHRQPAPFGFLPGTTPPLFPPGTPIRIIDPAILTAVKYHPASPPGFFPAGVRQAIVPPPGFHPVPPRHPTAMVVKREPPPGLPMFVDAFFQPAPISFRGVETTKETTVIETTYKVNTHKTTVTTKYPG